MNTQPENKDKSEQKISKTELTEQELAKVSGGFEYTERVSHGDLQIQKYIDKASAKLF